MNKQACITAFGKRFSELDAAERVLYFRALKAANYYRHYERNKIQQRKDKSWKKLEILDVLGLPAACERCGYDRYIGALDFHHKNPAEKDGRVTTVEEARKCQLLCSNCHREIHAEHPHRPGHVGPKQRALHPKILAYLTAVGISRPDLT